MMKEYWSIEEIADYLGMKKSSLYSKVEGKEIPHYRIGKRIKFKLTEVEEWMQDNKAETVDVRKKAKELLRSTHGVRPRMDINRIMKKSIDESKSLKYNCELGNQVKSNTQKGGDHGLV